MLKMIHGKAEEAAEVTTQQICSGSQSTLPTVSILEAAWPSPFVHGLEYNCAAHGTWNIVHTGMLIPGSHQIYVCADNCNRGVVLTAAEMNATDRFSFIRIEEEDLFLGGMEERIIEGVSEILEKLSHKPTVVLLFTVCVHHFMGADIAWVFERLRERHPGQLFLECYMDPIRQKEGPSPDEKLRAVMYDVVETRPKKERQVNLVGGDLALRPESDILRCLKRAGYTICQLAASKSFDRFLEMGSSVLNVCTYPPGREGAKRFSKRLGIPLCDCPMTFSYEEIDRQMETLCGLQKLPVPDPSAARRLCERDLRQTANELRGIPVAIDGSAVTRPLGLARLLRSSGIDVRRVFADTFLAEEKADFFNLRKEAPDLLLSAVSHHSMRLFHPKKEGKVLAIGQKAAYFYRTPFFVNMVEDGGLQGYGGIRTLLAWMREAVREEKDTRDLVGRKGLGCVSCI